ncbi:hypothetical protein V6000_003449 [Aspergillus fumigatus]
MASTTSSITINVNSHCETPSPRFNHPRPIQLYRMQGYAVRMVPLDTDGLENADEYVMQLVICDPEFPVGPIISFIDMCEPVSGSAQMHITAMRRVDAAA